MRSARKRTTSCRGMRHGASARPWVARYAMCWLLAATLPVSSTRRVQRATTGPTTMVPARRLDGAKLQTAAKAVGGRTGQRGLRSDPVRKVRSRLSGTKSISHCKTPPVRTCWKDNLDDVDRCVDTLVHRVMD